MESCSEVEHGVAKTAETCWAAEPGADGHGPAIAHKFGGFSVCKHLLAEIGWDFSDMSSR